MKNIYLDHSATTPVDPRVADKMTEVMTIQFGNPSSIHQFGKAAKQVMEDSRDTIAASLHCQPKELFFTSGGTEADNLALLGTVKPGGHLITTAYEHHAVLYTAEYLEKNGVSVTFIHPDEYGYIHPESVASAMTPKTRLVSVMHVNNEVGTINPVKEIAELVKSKGALFHTDMVQSFGKLETDLRYIPADMASISGHKIYGPKGIGALFVRQGVQVETRTFGGHHERGLRAGTENMPGIAGFAKAAEICQAQMQEDARKIAPLRDRLQNEIIRRFPEVKLNGHPQKRLYSICSLSFTGVEGETMLINLDLEGIAVSTGSACSSGSTKPSHVLLSLGMPAEAAQSTIRFSLGRSNTPEDIEYAIETITKIMNRLKEMGF